MNATPDFPPLIELNHVDVASARDGEMIRIHKVDWRLHSGDYWLVGGPHASGKSDLISTATGLQRPVEGTVSLFGIELSTLPPAELLRQRQRIGVVFKNGGRMFSELSVAENIALPLCYRNNLPLARPSERVQALLDFTELTPFAYSLAGSLSVNWQQRVGLARSLALDPEVLFLDEPVAGLELRHRRWWVDALAQLSHGIPCTQSRPITLVILTNDVELWLSQARQFALIRDDRWHAIKSVEELRSLTIT